MAFVSYYHQLAPAFYMPSYVSFTSLYTMTMLIVRSWIVHLTPIPCLPQSSQASTLCVVSGFVLEFVSLLITWKCVPLVDLLNAVMGRTKRACHLHPILSTWDAVINCTPVNVFFPFGVRLCSKPPPPQKKKQKKSTNRKAHYQELGWK